MTEVITHIQGKAYRLNPNFVPPEVSCLDCFYYKRDNNGCVPDQAIFSKGRYAQCQAGGSKSLWRPRLGGR